MRKGGGDLRAGDGHYARRLRRLLRAPGRHLSLLRPAPAVCACCGGHPDVCDVPSPSSGDLCALRQRPPTGGAMGRGAGVRNVLHRDAAPARDLRGLWVRASSRLAARAGSDALL